ncbi:MAG TPA: pitrilysin family protein, partial [Bryobacteraceae bacterium]|nr:pitrilysin family protein [Bryobacteraceae bacterium]
KELVEAMYPMAASVSSQVDKELTVFTGTTHIDNLDAFYSLLAEMLLEPGFRPDDLERLRSNQINYLRTSLRGNNDEELGKEVLYEQIYAGHPYGHVNQGKVSHLQSVTMDDLRKHYAAVLTRSNLIIGVAGGYPDGFMARIQKDFSKLPEGKEQTAALPAPKPLKGLTMTLVEKATRSVAFSLGHPISVKRGDPDFAALLVAQSHLGQHRSGGRLFERIRQSRGINYGDYAYIEYFPGGMFAFEPPPNLTRQQQIFQIWIRPVEPPTAHFSLRLAMFELDNFVKQGLTQADFDRARNFLSKNVNLLLKTKSAELGYLIDSKYYRIPEYDKYLKGALAKLTLDDVNKAIKKHLSAENLHIVVIGQGMDNFKEQILKGEPSPMTYNAPKPEDIVKEDKIVANWKIPVSSESIKIVPANTVFE